MAQIVLAKCHSRSLLVVSPAGGGRRAAVACRPAFLAGGLSADVVLACASVAETRVHDLRRLLSAARFRPLARHYELLAKWVGKWIKSIRCRY